MKSPCFTCCLKSTNKNNPTCLNCEERVKYVDWLEGAFGVLPTKQFRKARPTVKLLNQAFPNATAAQLGLPECKNDGCGAPVHAAGFCLNCYVANWRVKNPQKYKSLRARVRRKKKQKTLQLNFSVGDIFGNKGPKKDATAILNDLILIAEEELRPTTTQAILFIRDGIRQWKKENIAVVDTTLERKDGVLVEWGGTWPK